MVGAAVGSDTGFRYTPNVFKEVLVYDWLVENNQGKFVSRIIQ